MTTITADQSLRTAREAVVRAHMQAEANQDVAGILASFSEANYDVVPLGAPTNGAAAVDELWHGMLEAFPDFTPEELSLHHGDDIVFVDTMIRGTHRGTWAGVPATGRRMEVRCGCIFHFQQDRLVKETVYFDHATLLAQIGVNA
jgi:steroid delta-isomerase-like uncharacterized protein